MRLPTCISCVATLPGESRKFNVHVNSQRVQKYAKSSRTQNVKKAMPTLNTELTKNYNRVQGLL